MADTLIQANGLELCYETFGNPADPSLLLIMGFTAQMTAWPTEFCQDLADQGHHVIRFDNRDVGLSSKSNGPLPDVMTLMTTLAQGGNVDPADVPYTLSDMAADAVGLLDALNIAQVDVVGASMGGMIVQHLAFEHPERLRTATSIMSTTGNPEVGQAQDHAMAALLSPAPLERNANIERSVKVSQAIGGPLWNKTEARDRAERTYDRMFHPTGPAFQLAAILASGDRTERLADVACPFLAIHGAADPLIDVSGGRATADAVPGADLLVLSAMGHDLPRPLWPQINGAIHGITARGSYD